MLAVRVNHLSAGEKTVRRHSLSLVWVILLWDGHEDQERILHGPILITTKDEYSLEVNLIGFQRAISVKVHLQVRRRPKVVTDFYFSTVVRIAEVVLIKIVYWTINGCSLRYVNHERLRSR